MKTDFYDDEFIIKLTIEGTSYEKVEVKVTDPLKTIREQISSIVSVFKLSYIGQFGDLFQYILGRFMEDGCEEILEFEDADGCEQTLVDYNVQPGDHLLLVRIPLVGGAIAKIKFKSMQLTADVVLHKFILDWNLRYIRTTEGLFIGWGGNNIRFLQLGTADGSRLELIQGELQDLDANGEITVYILINSVPLFNFTIVEKIKFMMYCWKNKRYLKELKKSNYPVLQYEWISPTLNEFM